MNERIFEGRLAGELAPEDRERRERLKAVARMLVRSVRDGLERDGFVRIHGFGTFRLKPVAARKGRDPRTGRPIEIPAGRRVMFRPAKALRERVDPGPGAATPLGEPHASREAMLGADNDSPSEETAEPWSARAAAAAIPDRVVTAHGPVPPTRPASSTTATVARSADEGGDAAANEASPASPRSVDERASSARVPAAAHASGDADSASREVAPEERGGRRGVWLLAALVLLLALAVWWLWPAPATEAPVATTGDEPVAAETADTETAGDTGATAETDGAAGGTGAAGDAGSGAEDAASAEAGDGGGGADSEAAGTSATAAAGDAASATVDDGGARETVAEEAGAESGAGEDGTAGTGQTGGEAAGRDEPTVVATPEPVAEATAVADGGTPAASEAEGGAADTGEPAAATEGGDAVASAAGTDASGTAADGAADASATGDGAPWFAGADYSVRRGDTLWGIAERRYVNPYYWPHVWNHNGAIANPHRIEIGQGVWLPPLQGEPRRLTAADRRSIAEGYLRLYRFRRERGADNARFALVGARHFDAGVLPPELRARSQAPAADTRLAVFRARLRAAFPGRRSD